MRSLIRLSDYSKNDMAEIFQIADDLQRGKYKEFLKGKTIVMFFPESSIRTRITFEKGIHQLGGQTILFPPSALDKREDIRDVVGYLNNWADGVIVRHRDISLLEKMARYAKVPIINALTDVNHPCEMLADMYALSKIRTDFTKDHYLFVGAVGNIGLAWKEAAELAGFSLTQSCPPGYEMEGVAVEYQIEKAMQNKDIICTDSLPGDVLEVFQDYRVTSERMRLANEGAVLNPCPPFYRGEEVSAEVMESKYFVGYEFKEYLLEVQQAIVIFNMTHEVQWL